MAERSGEDHERVIRTPDHRLRVFISSTLKELAEERDTVRQSVLKLRLVPVMFEAGARPHPARELYQAYLAQSHIFIGIYWQSYGWVAPDMKISGLEDEYNLSANLPRLIYIKAPAPQRDAGLDRLLARLQDENTASYKRFTSIAELGELVENDLALLLTESYESASRTPAVEVTPRPLTNLPFPRNPILGRERELKDVCTWFEQPDIGLVTLTGPGGCGKSRLALEAGLELRNDFSDGVYLVRLSQVTDPMRVVPAIAETLGLHESAQGLPVEEVLTRSLSGKNSLLILDNFEQVLPAAGDIAELLEHCPRLKILVTSRAPLHLRGEKELPLQPLPVPALKQALDSARLSQYASVQLFIQRAQSIRPDFEVTNANAPAIAEICHRLDGLPLAIELAAARIRLLHPGELLARLNNRFDILRGGTRDLPQRQQTLRAAIDWSYNLLSDPARKLFRRLSVFAGSWSLEAAEAVCNLNDDLGSSIFEEIESLVDLSMAFPVEGLEDRQRFAMLQSIREYAAEKLEESGEAVQVRCLHGEYFLRFARQVEPHIRTAERVRSRAILEQEMENIRSVLDWGLADSAGLTTAQELTVTLSYFWAVGGSMSEGRELAQKFLVRGGEATSPRIRAGLLGLTGALTLVQGSNEAARAALDEGLRLARLTGDKQLIGTLLLWDGSGYLVAGDLGPAAHLFQESLEVFDEIGDEWSAVLSMLWLSNVYALRGDPERSSEIFERTLAMARRQGDPWSLVAPLADVAQAAFADGDLHKAEATLNEIESLCRIVGDNWTLAWALNGEAQLDLLRSDSAAAAARIREAIQVARENGYQMALVFALLETAAFLTQRHRGPEVDVDLRAADLRTAACLCGATAPLADNPAILGRGLGTRENYDFMLDLVHSAIEPEIWDGAFPEGGSIPLDQAVDIAGLELGKA